MTRPEAIVLRAPGINCDRETAAALKLSGANPSIIPLGNLARDPSPLETARILVFPGGFSFGDDLGAGRIFALQIRQQLAEPMKAFLERGGLVLGICNGFQALVALGWLPGGEKVALVENQSGHYECRWVRLTSSDHRCVYLPKDMDLRIPIAHAEGRVVSHDQTVYERLVENGQVPLRYADASGPTEQFPENPNGAPLGIASLTDETGRIFGLMPHPDRAFLATHDADDGHPGDQGRLIFDGLVRAAQESA